MVCLFKRRQINVHIQISDAAASLVWKIYRLSTIMLRGANVFITGCSRGIGLELVRQLAVRKDTCIIATCRSPAACPALSDLNTNNSNVHVLGLDVTQFDSFSSVSGQVLEITGDSGVNILINNAGVSPKSTRINLVTDQQMLDTITSNVIGPLMLTKALLPQLKQGALLSQTPSLIVNMSSILGSIAENTRQGGLYPYRTSKSALNAVTRSLSLDLAADNVQCVSLHPGWVRTDMGGHHAPVSVEESVTGVLQQIDQHTSENNGGFIDFTGNKLPW